MIRGKVLLVAGAALAFSLSLSGCAKELGIQPQFAAKVEMTSGDKVRLFYGGTQEAKTIFCSGETVSVFRANPRQRSRYIEVGKVRIDHPIDDHFLEGVVVEGKVEEGDLARKGIAACLLVPPSVGGESR